jgi:hypothetical protein
MLPSLIGGNSPDGLRGVVWAISRRAALAEWGGVRRTSTASAAARRAATLRRPKPRRPRLSRRTSRRRRRAQALARRAELTEVAPSACDSPRPAAPRRPSRCEGWWHREGQSPGGRSSSCPKTATARPCACAATDDAVRDPHPWRRASPRRPRFRPRARARSISCIRPSPRGRAWRRATTRSPARHRCRLRRDPCPRHGCRARPRRPRGAGRRHAARRRRRRASVSNVARTRPGTGPVAPATPCHTALALSRPRRTRSFHGPFSSVVALSLSRARLRGPVGTRRAGRAAKAWMQMGGAVRRVARNAAERD